MARLKVRLAMRRKKLDSRTLLSKHDKRPMPALFYRPCQSIAEVGLKKVPSAMSWDLDIDRWVNEGGAIHLCPRDSFEI
jgi:hypothetical protein